MRKIAAALVLPLFLMVGCADAEGEQSPNDSITNLDQTKGRLVRDGDTDIIVRKFTIDGTTCIMVSYEGGISCDWNREETP